MMPTSGTPLKYSNLSMAGLLPGRGVRDAFTTLLAAACP
jgi:hypothetical protein